MSGIISFSKDVLVNNIRPGAVIHKYCDFTKPPKNKFLVIASVEPDFLVLIINSSINNFFIKNGTDKYHVKLSNEEHGFLNHDSYANCVQAHNAFNLNDIEDQIEKNYDSLFKGFLSDSCVNSVYRALDNDIIRNNHKCAIMKSFENQFPHLKNM